MSRPTINLAFCCFPKNGAVADFNEVGRRIARLAPDIRTYVVRTDLSVSLATGWLRLAARPTVAVEMDRMKWFHPIRGRRLTHLKGLGKLEEYRRLETAGCPVAPWIEITPDTRLDVAQWGAYVVVKPSRGGRGAFVRINRTGRVKYTPPDSLPDGHPGRRGPMIAQRFIYTGTWPVAYRVLTYFGRAVVCIRYVGPQAGAPIEGPDKFAGGSNIVASVRGSHIDLCADAEVLSLARRVHTEAFPEVPSLGQDIVRDAVSGKLYVCEVNPSGKSWMLTSPGGQTIAREFGLDFHAQFGALDIIAETSIDIARRYAL